MDTKDPALLRAQARVEAKLEYFKRVVTYLFVNGVLLVINLLSNPENLWVKWPIVLWGLFVAWDGVKVFFLSSTSLEGMRQKMLERELEKARAPEERDDQA